MSDKLYGKRPQLANKDVTFLQDWDLIYYFMSHVLHLKPSDFYLFLNHKKLLVSKILLSNSIVITALKIYSQHLVFIDQVIPKFGVSLEKAHRVCAANYIKK